MKEKNMSFFVKKVEFPENWNDQVISLPVKEKIEVITSQLLQSGISHQNSDSQKKGERGIMVLFNGASKKEGTYSAMFLSKSVGMHLHKIDLSKVVSKYIGETEKNLDLLFASAENKDWILFFDEADALFVKRTEIKDSHDRYANLDISYLLQKIEEYMGVVILASNNKSEIDSVFLKRNEFIIDFTDR